MTAGAPARVVSVNVGRPRPVDAAGRTVETAIWKAPVAGRVRARGVNLDGDDQADRQAHGGPDKAVYAYGVDDYAWWEAELGRPLEPGTFGENLTVAGLAVSDAVVGERWAVGTATFEVSQPRRPCGKLGLRMGDPRFPRRFARAGRPGAYLRIVAEPAGREASVGAGDEVVHRPDHGLTVAAVARAGEGDLTLVADLLAAPELPVHWVDWAFEHAAHELHRGRGGDRLRAAVARRLRQAGVAADDADAAVAELARTGRW